MTTIPEPRPPTSILLLTLLGHCLMIYGSASHDFGMLALACTVFVLEACHFAHASWRILARRADENAKIDATLADIAAKLDAAEAERKESEP